MKSELALEIDKMIREGGECLKIECEDEKEVRRIYNRIYAYTKRRNSIPVQRLIRENTIYVINDNK